MAARLKIGVVDSGVNPAHPHIGGEHRIAAGAGIGLYRIEPGAYLDYLGHGTAVCGAICSHSDQCQLLIAKVFDRTLNTRAEMILRGIEWCVEQGADAVNLSLGTHNPAHGDAFAEWASKVPLVAAAGALPGGLTGVITIEADASLVRDAWRRIEGLRFAASPHPRPIPGRDEADNLGGVSFAVANFTGLAAAYRQQHGCWPWQEQ
ncbi:hypothetical protein F183_A50850 [Bryobacterales bacterium F-183]|nr:hypothetical protein F183_A50850 [Bryobacterales bacterium F-183]